MRYLITAFFWLCSSSDIINPTLCENKYPWKKMQYSNLQTKASDISHAHSKHFVAKLLLMAIWDQFCFWWKKMYKFSLAVYFCLHCVLKTHTAVQSFDAGHVQNVHWNNFFNTRTHKHFCPQRSSGAFLSNNSGVIQLKSMFWPLSALLNSFHCRLKWIKVAL